MADCTDTRQTSRSTTATCRDSYGSHDERMKLGERRKHSKRDVDWNYAEHDDEFCQRRQYSEQSGATRHLLRYQPYLESDG